MIVPINKFEGSAVSVSVDPRYVLTILVDSSTEEPPGSKYTKGSKHNFALHSASRALKMLDEEAKGRSFNFSLAFGPDGGPRYIDFKAQAVSECAKG